MALHPRGTITNRRKKQRKTKDLEPKKFDSGFNVMAVCEVS